MENKIIYYGIIKANKPGVYLFPPLVLWISRHTSGLQTVGSLRTQTMVSHTTESLSVFLPLPLYRTSEIPLMPSAVRLPPELKHSSYCTFACCIDPHRPFAYNVLYLFPLRTEAIPREEISLTKIETITDMATSPALCMTFM